MFKAVVLTLGLLALGTSTALADKNPTNPSGPLSASETAFVHGIQADLMKRFPTAAAAEHAGYVRYTNLDDTGAISYTNNHWDSIDSKHPSQLWYDTSGTLLGADFSVLSKAAAPPKRFGVGPGRWTQFDAHVHYVTIDSATGKKTYDLATSTKKFVAAGGSLRHPSAATLVKIGAVKRAADVATVFLFPDIWDVIVWVKPNPAGAFVDKNPTVSTKKS